MLRLVHRLVREIENFLRGFRFGAIGCTYADASRHRYIATRLGFLDCGPQSLSRRMRLLRGVIWKANDELISTTPPIDFPSSANDRTNRSNDLIETCVAFRMALRIVYSFKII